MSATVLQSERAPDSDANRPTRRRSARRDAAVAVLYGVLAFAVLHNQWLNLGTSRLRESGQDQSMWEWFFAVAAHSVANLDNPLTSGLQNAPGSVNMMANTAMLGLSIPLTPVTLAFGPTVTFTLALTLGLATTAFGWYFLLGRTIVSSRVPAVIGGLISGFAPGMISHANAHPNFVFLGVLPFIALATVRIAAGVRVSRNTLVIGLLTAWQVMLGEEPLLIFVITFAVFGVVYYAWRPRQFGPAIRNLVPAALIAGMITALLVALPVWWQFYGPESYKYLKHDLPGNDLLAITSFPPQSIGGRIWPGPDLAINATEQNAYFGPPLLILTVLAAVYLWRSAVARSAIVTAVVVGVLSLGGVLSIGGRETAFVLPGRRLHTWPLLQSVLETRYALAVVPLIALIIALAVDKAIRSGRIAAALWSLGVLVALVPLIPVPPPVTPISSTPAFFADGAWRDFVDDGSVVVVPLPGPGDASALRWQYDSNFDFRLAAGYFVGPSESNPKQARYGAQDKPTGLLLGSVRDSGTAVAATDAQQVSARADLAAWDADVVVLPPTPNEDALRTTIDSLLDTNAVMVDGSWVWDVRS